MKSYEAIVANRVMDEKFILAKAQTESKLSNDESVAGEPEML